jgi:hypothetical protein
MQVPSYAWPYKSGALGVFLTIFAVVAYDLNRGDLGAGFMVGYVTALAVTVVEFLRTRHSYEWTWLKFLNAQVRWYWSPWRPQACFGCTDSWSADDLVKAGLVRHRRLRFSAHPS